MIHYEDWRLRVDTGPVIARQYDNLTGRLEIEGAFPQGWEWTLLVQADKHLDLIALTATERGLGVDLTAEMLALSGYYTVQLRATQGELVRHTNQVRIFVPDSLSGDANWPEIPSEFSQAEAKIRELNGHPPVPGDEGFWLVWDLERDEYVTSDLPLPDVPAGPDGKAATIKVGETVTGDPDTPAKVENTGTENEAVLRFTIPRGLTGPTGATPDISVEVTGLPAGSEPTVSVSGTPEKPVIALGIPAGKQGNPGEPGEPGTPGKDGNPGAPGQTPNITIGQVDTLPAGSEVTATITGEMPNLVLNLGIPQGPAGDGVPPTDGVPEDYVLTPAGWAAPAGGRTPLTLLCDVTLTEDSAQVVQQFDKPYKYLECFFYAPKMAQNQANNNTVWLWPNGLTGWRFNAGLVSIYGMSSVRRTIISTPVALFVDYDTQKNTTIFGGGISSISLNLDNTDSPDDVFRAGYRYIVYGREEI